MRRLCLIVSVLVIAGSASALTVFVDPPFAGAENSTMAIWGFDTDAEPALPEVVDNPFGAPEAAIVEAGLFDKWWIDVDQGTGRQGVWKTEGHYEFAIDNSDLTGPDTYKEIVVQMVYDSDPLDDRVWLRFSADGSGLTAGIEPDERTDLGDGYSLATWNLELRPNPTEETIYLLPYYSNLYIDAIRIDTVCVPEPATMGILGLGGVFGLLRRRRR